MKGGLRNNMEENKKPMDWIKNLLNNLILLKWVRKFSADNLLEDNKIANDFNIKCNEESISVGDGTLTKLLVTQARFDGKEYVRYNLKQLREALDLVGSEGELIISEENNNELFLQVKDTIVVVSPLPKKDKKKEE